MAFVLETVLLVLLSAVYGHDTQDTEIVLLPLWNTEDDAEVEINIKPVNEALPLYSLD